MPGGVGILTQPGLMSRLSVHRLVTEPVARLTCRCPAAAAEALYRIAG